MIGKSKGYSKPPNIGKHAEEIPHPFVEKESNPQVTEEPAVTQSTSSTVLNVVELSRRLLDGMGEIWMEIRQLEQSINPPPNYDNFSTRDQ